MIKISSRTCNSYGAQRGKDCIWCVSARGWELGNDWNKTLSDEYGKGCSEFFWCWAFVDYAKDSVLIQRKGLNNFKLWTKLFIWCFKSIILPAEWRISWIGPRTEEGEVNRCHCAYPGDWRFINVLEIASCNSEMN